MTDGQHTEKPRLTTAGLAALVCLVLASCTTPRTEVILVMDTDLDVPSEVDTFEAIVTAPDGRQQTVRANLGGSEAPLPRTTGVIHSGGPLGTYSVEATARLGDTVVVSRRARFDFVTEESRILELFFLRSCLGASCGGDQTCDETGCRSVDVSTDEMPVYDGTIDGLGPPPDAGADSGMDVGMDAGPDAADTTPVDTSVDVGVCPDVCNGGCGGGTCLILDPTADTRCPDGLPCHIRCEAAAACPRRLHCPEDAQPCTVDCIGDGSCEASTDCERASSCTVTCMGSASCAGDNDCKNAAACTFNCDGDDSCSGRTQCKGDNCVANCAGVNACAGEVSCDADSRCAISCSGQDSCARRTTCNNACACSVDCSGVGSCAAGSRCPTSCEVGDGCTADGACDTCP